MKTRLLAGMAWAGFTCAVFGQGAFYLDNSSLTFGLAINGTGIYYNGIFGLEVWMLNGANQTVVDHPGMD